MHNWTSPMCEIEKLIDTKIHPNVKFTDNGNVFVSFLTPEDFHDRSISREDVLFICEKMDEFMKDMQSIFNTILIKYMFCPMDDRYKMEIAQTVDVAFRRVYTEFGVLSGRELFRKKYLGLI